MQAKGNMQANSIHASKQGSRLKAALLHAMHPAACVPHSIKASWDDLCFCGAGSKKRWCLCFRVLGL